jgi:hypothetical protein
MLRGGDRAPCSRHGSDATLARLVEGFRKDEEGERKDLEGMERYIVVHRE